MYDHQMSYYLFEIYKTNRKAKQPYNKPKYIFNPRFFSISPHVIWRLKYSAFPMTKPFLEIHVFTSEMMIYMVIDEIGCPAKAIKFITLIIPSFFNDLIPDSEKI